ncbi:MAG TPA: hypothetical protein VNA24_29465, partial [Hyalangium sp.]|nr:hypothetical protein [Hyalangium sp.]
MAGQRKASGAEVHQTETKWARLVAWFGSGAQHLDHWFNQPGGGLRGRWKIERHSQAVLVLPTLLTFLLVWGPVPGAGLRLVVAIVSALAVLALCGYAHWWVAQKKWPLVWEAGYQFLLFGLIVAAFLVGWRISGSGGKAADNQLYVHAFFPLMLVPLTVVLMAIWLAGKLMRGRGQEWELFRTMRLQAKLFRRPDHVAIRRRTMVQAGVMMLVGRPMHILVIPALFALLLPREWLEGWLILLITLVWMSLLIAGETSPRLSGTLRVVTYLFLRGGGRVVSWLMIALAAGRLLDVQYVSTVLDNASKWTILQLLLTVYVIFWWVDYWLNRLLLDQLLHVLGKVEPGGARVVLKTSQGLR